MRWDPNLTTLPLSAQADDGCGSIRCITTKCNDQVHRVHQSPFQPSKAWCPNTSKITHQKVQAAASYYSQYQFDISGRCRLEAWAHIWQFCDAHKICEYWPWCKTLMRMLCAANNSGVGPENMLTRASNMRVDWGYRDSHLRDLRNWILFEFTNFWSSFRFVQSQFLRCSQGCV